MLGKENSWRNLRASKRRCLDPSKSDASFHFSQVHQPAIIADRAWRRAKHFFRGRYTLSSTAETAWPPHIKMGWPEEVVYCSAPYPALVYAWNDAEREASIIIDDESRDEKLACDDLRELLRLISTSSGDIRLDKYFKERKTLMDEEAITFAALWTLFPPRTLVLRKPCHEELQVFFVDSCDKLVSDDEGFEIILHTLDWDGSCFFRVPFKMVIDS